MTFLNRAANNNFVPQKTHANLSRQFGGTKQKCDRTSHFEIFLYFFSNIHLIVIAEVQSHIPEWVNEKVMLTSTYSSISTFHISKFWISSDMGKFLSAIVCRMSDCLLTVLFFSFMFSRKILAYKYARVERISSYMTLPFILFFIDKLLLKPIFENRKTTCSHENLRRVNARV